MHADLYTYLGVRMYWKSDKTQMVIFFSAIMQCHLVANNVHIRKRKTEWGVDVGHIDSHREMVIGAGQAGLSISEQTWYFHT